MIGKKDLKFEKTVLVGVVNSSESSQKSKEYLDELKFLTHTAGGLVLKIFIQKIKQTNPKTFIGSGKLNEIKFFVYENDITTVIFDDELSPVQLRNIEEKFDDNLLDLNRTMLKLSNEGMEEIESVNRKLTRKLDEVQKSTKIVEAGGLQT